MTFAAFNTAVAVINNSGHTSFRTRVKGPGIVANGNDQGIWSEASGILDLVARNDDPAPVEGTGVEFKSLFDPQIGNPGATSFSGFIRGTGVVIGSNDMGIWSDASGSLSLVARRGSPAPGLVDVDFSVFNSPVSASTGQSTFFSLLQGSGVGSTDYRSIWSEGGGSLHLVARMGSPAPGAEPDTVFDNFGQPVINAAGQIAFQATLSGPGVDPTNSLAFFSEGTGTLDLVAREGASAPGVGPGVLFDDFNNIWPTLNDLGQTAFSAGIVGPGVSDLNDRGVWSEGSGTLALVAREGDQAPGTAPGVVFSEVLVSEIPGYPGDPFFVPAFEGHVIDGAGRTAFAAGLSGPAVDETNNLGIWSEGTGSLTLVARTGSQAPGTGAGVNFAFFGYLINDAMAMNASGRLALRGVLVGAGVDSSNNTGIWAQDLGGALRLVIRAGDSFELAPGDTRTVAGLGFASGSGGQDGRRTGFNDLGQVAFVAAFTDGSSGVFVASPCLAADVNADSFIDVADVGPFATVLVDPSGASEYERCAADVNGDTLVNGEDIPTFLEELLP